MTKKVLSNGLIKKWKAQHYNLEQYFYKDGTRQALVFVKCGLRVSQCGLRVSQFEFYIKQQKLTINEFDRIFAVTQVIIKQKPTLTMIELSLVNETVKELGWK